MGDLVVADAELLQTAITMEICNALGLPRQGAARRLLTPLFQRATRRFSLWMADFDRQIAQEGIGPATAALLAHFSQPPLVCRDELIPSSGPLLVASNHPGSVDGLVVLSELGREDVRLVISGIPFTRSLPAAQAHLIHAPEQGPGRMQTMREMLRHLQSGGAVLIFASGLPDPDPEILPGAQRALADWSLSLDLALRSVPETRLLPVIVSGVLAPAAMRSPLVRLQPPGWKRQRLAEFFQIIGQVLHPGRVSLQPHVSFGSCFGLADLGGQLETAARMERIWQRSSELLAAHRKRLTEEWSMGEPVTLPVI